MFLPHGHGQVEAGGPPVAGLHHVRLCCQLGRQLEAHVRVWFAAVPGAVQSTVQYNTIQSTVQITVQYITGVWLVAVPGGQPREHIVRTPRARPRLRPRAATRVLPAATQ